MTLATESGHWYTRDGIPAYETESRNGEMRPTTLRDARNENLVPSVSMIMGCAKAPQLEAWKIKQHLMCSATLPLMADETPDEFIARVIALTKEKMDIAPDLGSAIHGDIEKCLAGKEFGNQNYVAGALKALREWCGDRPYASEKSFAHPLGYGGKVDIHKPGFVADFKTKEFDADKLPITYENHSMQLTAYRHGLGMPTAHCAIIYVSTSIPGLTHTVEVSPEELDRGWEMFKALLAYWKHKNRYLTGD